MRNIRNQFPIFKKQAKKPLAYLDNAATTQKPESVLRAMDAFYRSHNASVHRGVYALEEAATAAYERVRDQARDFVRAAHREEIVFTSGATASINAVVSGFAETFLRNGDHVLLTDMEHHAMIVPWHAAAARKKIHIDFAPLTEDGRIYLPAFKKLLITRKPKFVGIAHVSNVLGTENPVREMIAAAHKIGAVVLVDAAQSVAHIPVNVQKMDCDFLAFSGHKMYGPTGVGVLYGKKELLNMLPPFILGGHMIERNTRRKTTYAPLPAKFEAGTPPIAQVIGLGAAISFLEDVGWKAIRAHDCVLTKHGIRALASVSGLTLLGPHTAHDRMPIFSFTMPGIHPHDMATLLDRRGIAVRAGHHCAEILHESLAEGASARASFSLYNTTAEVDALARALSGIRMEFY